MAVCPFCGVVTEIPHENQEGCVAALTAEIARLRNVLEHSQSTRSRPRWSSPKTRIRPTRRCLTANPSPGRLTGARKARLITRMPQTDTAAVALARDGDSDAFRGLVERHSRAVYRLAHRMTGNPQDAEDVVQETFLKAYRQLGRFESRANFGTWLHRIAVNCSIDLIRGRKHQETGHDAADLDLLDER